MENTGHLVTIDDLGQLEIPESVLKFWHLKTEGELELSIYAEGQNLVMEVVIPRCVLCRRETTDKFKGEYVCRNCRRSARRVDVRRLDGWVIGRPRS